MMNSAVAEKDDLLDARAGGQITPWHMEEDVSYRVFSDHVAELTTAVTAARVLS